VKGADAAIIWEAMSLLGSAPWSTIALAVLVAASACSPKSSTDARPEPVAASTAPESAPVPANPQQAPSAAPSDGAAPSAAASIDLKNCRPRGPAVRWEVEDDDVVRHFDAQGCPLGKSHCKVNWRGYKAAVDFMTDLQGKLKAPDTSALDDLVNYPLRVNGPPRDAHFEVHDRAAFLEMFDRIYTPETIKAILATDPRDVYCNHKGLNLGNGVLWAGSAKGHDGVIALNLR
jgi:hypothetical protein